MAPPAPKIHLRDRYDAVAAQEVPPELLDELRADPSAPLAATGAEIIKNGDTTLVVKTQWPIAGSSLSVAYKCVRRLTWIKRLTQAVGENRTHRTYRAGLRLQELGIPTARPLLLLTPVRSSLAAPSYIATEWLDKALPLGQIVREHRRRPEEGRLDELARKLGRLLGRMHRAGATHRDLKPENIMIQLAQHAGKEDRLWLIDLDGLRFRRWISPWRRRRDLSRLAVGVEESGSLRHSAQLRFLLNYIKERGNSNDWKNEWRQLRHATEQRAHQRRRRRQNHQTGSGK